VVAGATVAPHSATTSEESCRHCGHDLTAAMDS
jgi:hypothetical protein